MPTTRDGPSSEPPPRQGDPLVGCTVGGRYRVEAVLADGGMGRIYVARDPELGTVALKTLIPTYSMSRKLIERFRREAMILSVAQCPHVVRMHDWGELPDGRAFFVMEHVSGVPLSLELARLRGPMAPRRALRILLQLCDALAPAHELGIVHRDLKPENVMLSRVGAEDDVVKVLDFGLAKRAFPEPGITDAGQLVGTPTYMSPEQCRGDAVDARSDVYSLGVIAYEMLCGHPPFEAEQPFEIFAAHLERAVVPPSRRAPPVPIPAPLEWVILCCLHKDPGRRFSSLREVVEELTPIAEALSAERPTEPGAAG